MNVIGLIYIVTSPSKNVYIGRTTYSLKTRKGCHVGKANNKKSSGYNTKFAKAIRKYGNRLTWNVIDTVIDVRASVIIKLNVLEKFYILQYNSYKRGYNSTPGGDGGVPHTPAARRKISLAKKGMHSGENNPMYGRNHSTMTKQQIGQTKKESGVHAGIKNGRAKLNLVIANKIRDEYKLKNLSYSQLAIKYNVGKSTIARVINKENWK